MKEKTMMAFLVNTGVYIIEPDVVFDIQDSISVDFPEIIEMEKQKGLKLAAFPISEDTEELK